MIKEEKKLDGMVVTGLTLDKKLDEMFSSLVSHITFNFVE